MTNDAAHNLGHRSRLRQRFLAEGGQHIPDYELLELILFCAKPRGDVKPLAKRLIKKFGSFHQVIQASIFELKQVEEMGDAAVAAIKSVEVAAQRLVKAPATQRSVLQSWSSLIDYCQIAMGSEKIEQFRILFLNNKNALIADEVQQKGTVNHTPVYPREVVKRALELGASSIILAHNHPSGDATPSKDDIDMTRKIVEAAKTVNIAVHDHLIISASGHYSFKSYGLI